MIQKTIDELANKSKIIERVSSLSKQEKLVLYSIIKADETRSKIDENKRIFTSHVIGQYNSSAASFSMKKLTQRRIGGLITELQKQNMLETKVVSRGRYGLARDISILIPLPTKKMIFEMLQNELKNENKTEMENQSNHSNETN